MTGIIAFNLFTAVICAVLSVMNFTAGDVVPGSVMAGLCVMNVLLAVVNAS